jgi:alpha-galactosidase
MVNLASLLLVPLLLSSPGATALEADNNVGKLPALGWNSWNAYNCDISEDHFLSAAKKLIELGLKVNDFTTYISPPV